MGKRPPEADTMQSLLCCEAATSPGADIAMPPEAGPDASVGKLSSEAVIASPYAKTCCQNGQGGYRLGRLERDSSFGHDFATSDTGTMAG